MSRRRSIFGLFIYFALGLGAALVLAQDDAGWPMRGGDARNSGTSQHMGILSGQEAWTLDTQVGRVFGVPGLPAVARDGTIYVGVNFVFETPLWGELWAIRPDGTRAWRAPLLDSNGRPLLVVRTPAIASDGTIYVGWCGYHPESGVSARAVALLAFHPDGTPRWVYEPRIDKEHPSLEGPILGPDGTVYLALGSRFTQGGDEHGSILAIDGDTGNLLWRFITTHRDAFAAAPALSPDGRLYYVSAPFFGLAYLYCLDAATGALEWELLHGFGVQTAPAVDSDAMLYVHNYPDDGWLTKFDPVGNVLWSYDALVSTVRASPHVHDGKVYVPTEGVSGPLGMHVVHADTGKLLRILAPGQTTQSLAIDRAGNVYFFGRNAFLAYDAAGTLLWDAWANGSTRNSVVIGADGFILATNGTTGPIAYRPVTLPGDMNCDGSFNAGDIDPFFLALGDPAAWQAGFPGCDILHGDLNADGLVNGADIDPFFACLGGGNCP